MRYKIILLLFFNLPLYSQTFYETLMTQNIFIADTSNDVLALQTSENAFERLLKSDKKDWAAKYYRVLCNIRMADLLFKKDTASAKLKLLYCKELLKNPDTIKTYAKEYKILNLYIKLNELRVGKPNAKKINGLESEILDLKKMNYLNPRIHVIQAYYNFIFYDHDKMRNFKTIEILKTARDLFIKDKAEELMPYWGKKWTEELLVKANKKAEPKQK